LLRIRPSWVGVSYGAPAEKSEPAQDAGCRRARHLLLRGVGIDRPRRDAFRLRGDERAATPEVGILRTVLAVLDHVLLVFILVELLDTIRIISRERGLIIAEPFLLVGLIAVVRRILLVTAQIGQAMSPEEFQNLLAELGVMAGLVVVLTAALFFIRRTQRPERETESS
jgi:uncharacterized membrane protein (DUF373 family)